MTVTVFNFMQSRDNYNGKLLFWCVLYIFSINKMKINPVAYIFVALVLLGGLFFVFRPKDRQTAKVPSATTVQELTSSAPALEDVKTLELTIKDKKIVTGQPTLTVKEGDEVVIRIASDFADEFHLHGYDNAVELEKDVPGELKFTANLTGRFPFELENSKVELGAVEVLPK